MGGDLYVVFMQMPISEFHGTVLLGVILPRLAVLLAAGYAYVLVP